MFTPNHAHMSRVPCHMFHMFHVICPIHCEILGSNLQQPHQHHDFRAHFQAEPHNQAEANKWQKIFGGITCCGSASLKLCVCDVAYPWSQSPSPHSQLISHVIFIYLFYLQIFGTTRWSVCYQRGLTRLVH